MKRFTLLVTACLIFPICLSNVRAQSTRYFDVNDDGSGSGVQNDGTYSWDTAALFWNANANGSGPGAGTTAAWVNGDDAVFSAGTDAGAFRYKLDVAVGTTADGVTVEDGTVLVNSGLVDTGSGVVEVLTGAALEFKSAASATYGLNGAGTLKLSGGRLLGSNPTTGVTLLSNLKTIEINGTGGIEYNNGLSTEGLSNINGNVITGTGGNPATGGAGTLVKSGPDAIVYAGLDTGGGVFNWQLNSFAKLVVKQGSFRIKSTSAVNGQIDERLFGAVPVNTLADAITLDGGGIGATQSLTLDSKRGITIGPSGGYFDHGATGSINVPGPLTAAAGALLTIGSATSSTVSAAVFELSNPNNVTTFQGDVFMLRNTLQLDSSLNAAHFSGTGATASLFGTVVVASGVTFTAGSDGLDAIYDGSVADLAAAPGSGGIFTKTGAGTLSLKTASPAAAKWTNTGGININNGTIKYTTSNASFANTVPVSIAAIGRLSMNGVSDTFGSLSGAAGAIVDMKDTTAVAGNLTLAATSGTTTYGGTIIGGGNFTKAGAGSTATQILSGNSSLGTVAVNNGTLLNNATMTTSGVVTVGASGTLGGTGTIIGAVTNSGIIAPGAGVGTLSVTGNVTSAIGSHWAIELSGATADKLAVTGNINLSAAGDFLDITGSGTGSTWLIGTYTGTETGVFDTITSGYTVTYTGGNITLNAVPVSLPGDFNSDGKVDAGDYATWEKAEGTNNALANDNGLGTPIGPAHYDLWRANFGNPPGAGSGGGLSGRQVPEPTTLFFAGLAMFFGLAGRKR